jgi:flavin-dependent dehydrogenase
MVSGKGSNKSQVVVIGGGPAGIAAALAIRQRGLDITVLDSCVPPIDKPCGEGLMPDGVAALEKLGVTVPAIEAYPFRGIRFVSGGLSAEAVFPYGFALGVRRTNLHGVMLEHAEKVGVQFRWQTVVTGLERDGILVKGQSFRAQWVIGADGTSSRLRRWAGLDPHRRKSERYAFRRHYNVSPWSDFMELHWGRRGQLYVTPVGPEQVCVALISRDPSLRLDEALTEFPEVAKKVRGAAHGSVERGAVSVTRKLARVTNCRVALIGDASGGVDAITGEGLCLAFKQAELLADAIAASDLRAYQRGHRVLARRPALMADLMLLLEQRYELRERVMRAFQIEPTLFARMLAMHVGAVSMLDLAGNGVALGWKLLTV